MPLHKFTLGVWYLGELIEHVWGNFSRSALLHSWLSVMATGTVRVLHNTSELPCYNSNVF